MPFINILFDLAFGVIQVVVFVMLSVVNTSQKIDDSEKIY
jgi:F0F1-type ATP synthase membrane subunit a